MATRSIRLKAVFGDGTAKRIVTDKGFTHAWRITAGEQVAMSGWAHSKAGAKRAAGLYAMRRDKTEVVPAKIETRQRARRVTTPFDSRGRTVQK